MDSYRIRKYFNEDAASIKLIENCTSAWYRISLRVLEFLNYCHFAVKLLNVLARVPSIFLVNTAYDSLAFLHIMSSERELLYNRFSLIQFDNCLLSSVVCDICFVTTFRLIAIFVFLSFLFHARLV